MKKSFFCFFTICFLLSGILASAQQNEVTVNPITGSANVNIPLYTIKSGSLSASVNLFYGGNGIKVKDVENNGGIGWRVTGGGQISRELRGLPDDIQKDNAGNSRLGWIYNSNGTKINNMSIANNGTPNCANEATDITNLNNNFSDLSDTEPDLFSIDAPGLSCSFVFDNNHNIKTIPYQDVKIAYTTDLTTGGIASFTVINSRGVQYSFSNAAKSVRRTTNTVGSGSTAQTVSESNIVFYKNQYLQYKSGINYTSSWSLSSMTDPNGNSINFLYSSGLAQNAATPLELYIGGTTKTTQYWTIDTGIPLILSSILGATGSAAFSYADNYRTAIPLVNKIYANGVTYLLNYSSVYTSGSSYYRYFLRDLTTDQCNSNFKYHFSYNGETQGSGGYVTTLGDSTSKSIDYWGYQNSAANTDLSPSVNINPSNTAYQRYQVVTDNTSRSAYSYNVAGADRRATPAVVMAGALSQVSFFNNGSTSLTYESNDYYDPTGNIAVQGGGIRVKQVTVYDGINTANNIVRNYTYVNPSTGLTSGKPATLPVYAFTRPYTGSGSTAALWSASTVRSELDLSADDHTIYYGQVTLTQTGAGKTLYEYYVPGTNYDLGAIPSCNGCSTADWAPNMINIGRPSCVAAGFATNDISTYPFAPSTNYDFERGLIKKITNYNDAGAEVSESNYSYQRTGTPEVTTAIKFDDNSTVKSYLKYKTYTSAGELNQQVSNKVFDLNSTTLSQQTSINYFYNSAFHKLPTQTQTTKSDGAVVNNYVKYSKDYVASSANDFYVTALYNLQQQNVNIPIESYTQIVRGGITETTSAQLVKFKPFSINTSTLYLPAQSLQFFDQNGVTNFTPSSVASGLFVNDSKYVLMENDQLYDGKGFLQTKDDNHKHVQTVLSDLSTNLPLAVVSNAAANEIAYYSFAATVDNAQFIKTAAISGNSPGRTLSGDLALSLEAGGSFTKSITKNVIAKNYIFSIWINAATAGNINLTLTGTDNVPHVYSVAFTNTGAWKYYEIKVPVAALSSTFTAAFQNTASSAIAMDDVLFYPESAEVNTYKYASLNHFKIAETNTIGISRYFTSDALGRPSLTYDQDKQIIERKSYSYSDSFGPFTAPAFSSNDQGTAMINDIITFNPATNYNLCQFTGITYSWNFGDGSSAVNPTSNINQTHQYTAAGTYTVTETVTAPGYGTQSASYTITIHPPPPATVLVYYTNTCSAGSMSTVTFSQKGVVRYTFTESDLLPETTKIPEGSYSVQVRGTGTIGNVNIADEYSSNCLDLPLPNGRYKAVDVNLLSGGHINISLKDGPCN
ncbi:PKD domain-containing protein [Mucilaginibacter lappiensis]|uniref:PKD domain-containing protein n=1 Tax=Mucilaginibacter lappiensis TaxID=354630 RepID=A0A841JM19_9SPHI|nr:PKD domain-containing protein [Mucilaginibacter lappiensis]MBB6129405.1 hypothetical protein [Mucilaginibacter lappiensis]